MYFKTHVSKQNSRSHLFFLKYLKTKDRRISFLNILLNFIWKTKLVFSKKKKKSILSTV